MRIPRAAPIARPSFTLSSALSRVWPGLQVSVRRNDRAPRFAAGRAALAPISFGRSSVKPTKNAGPDAGPDPVRAAGTMQSTARAAVSAMRTCIVGPLWTSGARSLAQSAPDLQQPTGGSSDFHLPLPAALISRQGRTSIPEAVVRPEAGVAMNRAVQLRRLG